MVEHLERKCSKNDVWAVHGFGKRLKVGTRFFVLLQFINTFFESSPAGMGGREGGLMSQALVYLCSHHASVICDTSGELNALFSRASAMTMTPTTDVGTGTSPVIAGITTTPCSPPRLSLSSISFATGCHFCRSSSALT